MSADDTDSPPGYGTESPAEITVLFVDEDRDFLDLASRLLELETDGIDLVTERSPREALDRLDKRVDCVVSDYKMTEMDGIELLERVREAFPTVPFILFTGRGGEDVASEAISAGATDYIVKTGSPDQYAVLANRIENAVDRERAELRTARQERINAVVRIITRELIHQATREQVERTLCEELVGIEPYAFAQVSAPGSDGFQSRTRATDDDANVDAGAIADAIGTDAGAPETEAHGSGEPLVVDDVASGSGFDRWRAAVRESGLSSAVAVPIRHAGLTYGVLSIYAARPDAYGDAVTAAIAELAEFVGYALSSAELRQGMFSPTVTEVGLAVRDPSSRLIRLAESLGATVRLEEVVPRSDGSFTLFLDIEDGGSGEEATRDAIEGFLDAEEATVTTTEDGTVRWAVVMGACPVDRFADHGITVDHVTVDGERGHVLLEVPPDIDVRQVVELAESQFSEVELTQRRTRLNWQGSESPVSGVLADLTPRQREVLETAYRNGFFESPREMHTEEIASLLDMSQSALSRHLRKIQRTVFGQLVDDGSRE